MREETIFPLCCHEDENGLFLPHGFKFHNIVISQAFLKKTQFFPPCWFINVPIMECVFFIEFCLEYKCFVLVHRQGISLFYNIVSRQKGTD